MSKKNKKNAAKQFGHVMESLRDLGLGGKDTLQRLATTVRAEMPTLIVDEAAKGATKIDSSRKAEAKAAKKDLAVADRLKTGMKGLAIQINPFGEPAGARKVARELKRLNKQVKLASEGPKPRRSRLPYAIAIVLATVFGGGYWAVSSFQMPDIKVSQYVNYKQWFEKTAGIASRHSKQQAAHVTTVKRAERIIVRAPGAVTPITTAAPGHVQIKRSSPGAVGAKVAKAARAKKKHKSVAKGGHKAASSLAKIDHKKHEKTSTAKFEPK